MRAVCGTSQSVSTSRDAPFPVISAALLLPQPPSGVTHAVTPWPIGRGPAESKTGAAMLLLTANSRLAERAVGTAGHHQFFVGRHRQYRDARTVRRDETRAGARIVLCLVDADAQE